MSNKCVILRYQASQKPKTRKSLIDSVSTILKEHDIQVKTLQPLPYESSPTEWGFEVPQQYNQDYEQNVFYLYYMSAHRNCELEKTQKKLLFCNSLTAMPNDKFIYRKELKTKTKPLLPVIIDHTKGVEHVTQLKELQEQIEVLKNQTKKLHRSLAMKNRLFKAEVKNNAQLKRINEDLHTEEVKIQKKLCIAEKKVEVFTMNSKQCTSHLGIDTISAISLEPFRLDSREIALKSDRCRHHLSRDDLRNMKNSPPFQAYCPSCRHRGTIAFSEDWPMTYISNGLYLANLIEFNKEPLSQILLMREQGKLNDVKHFNLYKQSTNGLPPKLVPRMFPNVLSSPVAELLPVFPIDPTETYTMNSALLTHFFHGTIESYLKSKEKEISGARDWVVKKAYGKYKKIPMPVPTDEEVVEISRAIQESELFHHRTATVQRQTQIISIPE